MKNFNKQIHNNVRHFTSISLKKKVKSDKQVHNIKIQANGLKFMSIFAKISL